MIGRIGVQKGTHCACAECKVDRVLANIVRVIIAIWLFGGGPAALLYLVK